MKFSSSLLIATIGFFAASSHAAPANQVPCITSGNAKSRLLRVCTAHLGEVFAADFGTAYDSTLSFSNSNPQGCFRESDFDFICAILTQLYSTRVPEAEVVVREDCHEVTQSLYHEKTV